MGENSKIEWCDHTFNPWVGCQKVSPACDNCYAEAMMDKRYGRVQWGPHGERKRTSVAYWRQPLRWNKEARMSGERKRVFCASLADVFDNQVPAEWRLELWRLIAATPNLDWLLLTKRPENIRRMLPGSNDPGLRWPWRNVWLGFSAEDTDHYARRWAVAREIPAAVWFVSYEPALGPLDLTKIGTVAQGFASIDKPQALVVRSRPDWVICGGESGPNARPLNPQWARDVRDQCRRLGIAFHFKQWGEWVSVSEVAGAGSHFAFDDGRTVRRIGKRASGRLLDGVEHSEFPSASEK